MRSLLLTGLLLAAPAFAQSPVLLKRSPVAGQSVKYNLKMEMEVFGDTATYTSVVTETVAKVENGAWTVAITQADYKATLFGDEAAVADADMPKLAYTFAPDGELVSVEGDDSGANAYRLATLWTFPLPNKEVKFGDKWAFERKEAAEKGAMAGKYEFAVLAEEQACGQDALKCSVDFKETKGNDPAKVEGTVWFAKSDGSLAKLDVKWAKAPIPGSGAPMNGHVTYERQAGQ